MPVQPVSTMSDYFTAYTKICLYIYMCGFIEKLLTCPCHFFNSHPRYMDCGRQLFPECTRHAIDVFRLWRKPGISLMGGASWIPAADDPPSGFTPSPKGLPLLPIGTRAGSRPSRSALPGGIPREGIPGFLGVAPWPPRGLSPNRAAVALGPVHTHSPTTEQLLPNRLRCWKNRPHPSRAARASNPQETAVPRPCARATAAIGKTISSGPDHVEETGWPRSPGRHIAMFRRAVQMFLARLPA